MNTIERRIEKESSMKQKHEILLASGSPRRRELLTQAGFSFTVLTADVDETIEENVPENVVAELSHRKAEAVKKKLAQKQDGDNSVSTGLRGAPETDAIIVAADTIVACDGEILGKPADEEDAVRMLAELSGKTHEVFTGVTVILTDGSKITFTNCTKVTMYEISGAEIRDYVASREPMDKAGAYGIQGVGARLVEKIEGDYNNVVGFPLAHFIRVMEEVGEISWER